MVEARAPRPTLRGMSTVAIILAAEEAEHFPSSKYLEPLRDKLLLQHVIDDAATWPVDDVIVALGPNAVEIVDGIEFGRCTVVIDPEWEEGSASPLRATLDLVARDRTIQRCVVARGDQPGIEASVVAELIDKASETSADAVVPKYRYAFGWPIVLDYSMWAPLLGSEGSVDLQDVVASHATSMEEVWYDRIAPRSYKTADDFLALK